MDPDVPSASRLWLDEGMRMGLREESHRVEAGQGCNPTILLEGCQGILGLGWTRLHRHMRVNLHMHPGSRDMR